MFGTTGLRGRHLLYNPHRVIERYYRTLDARNGLTAFRGSVENFLHPPQIWSRLTEVLKIPFLH